MLARVKWGKFRIGDLFKIQHYGKQRSISDLQMIGEPKYNFVMQGSEDNGFVCKVPKQVGNDFNLISGNSISAFTHLNRVYYQEEPFYSKQGSNIYTLKNNFLNKKNAKFIVSAINSIIKVVEYGKNTASRLIEYKIQLPTKNNQPDFEFMEQFIGQLEQGYLQQLDNYLSVTGLNDIKLTTAEQQALAEFESWEWVGVKYQEVFNHIVQGRRLKKEDQIEGNIPFVMAGITNTGVVGYISNPVASFPENSITVDIFGNTFYRNYAYGAGDDTGCYWNDEKCYSKQTMLFFTTAMGKSLAGKFDYGNKLRSSQSLNFEMQLPTTANQPDYTKMETLISALQKLVICDVVNYTDERLQVTEALAC